MYSSCRNAVVQVIETSLNITLEKKLEISSGSELTEQWRNAYKQNIAIN